MTCLILSDLHLGAGDELEDFQALSAAPLRPNPAQRRDAMTLQHERFAALLAAHADAPRPQHLLLLGDIADIWLVRRPRERIVNALLRVMRAHAPWFAALHAWLAAGHRLTWVLGNHDQPLVDRAAWGLLADALPGLNAAAGGGPLHSFADPASGLYAEHGHQWDPLNRMRALGNPRADCPGRRIVRSVVRPLKPVFPLIDAGGSARLLLEQLWHSRLNPGHPVLPEVAGQLQRVVGRAAGPARALWEELRRLRGSGEARTPDFATLERHESAPPRRRIRQLLRGNPRAATGELPSPFRVLAAGHTHRALHDASGARVHINPGTWKAVLRRDGDGWLGEQRLHYAVVRPGSGGEWTVELREWGKPRIMRGLTT